MKGVFTLALLLIWVPILHAMEPLPLGGLVFDKNGITGVETSIKLGSGKHEGNMGWADFFWVAIGAKKVTTNEKEDLVPYLEFGGWAIFSIGVGVEFPDAQANWAPENKYFYYSLPIPVPPVTLGGKRYEGLVTPFSKVYNSTTESGITYKLRF